MRAGPAVGQRQANGRPTAATHPRMGPPLAKRWATAGPTLGQWVGQRWGLRVGQRLGVTVGPRTLHFTDGWPMVGLW